MPIDDENESYLLVIAPAERAGLILALTGLEMVIGRSKMTDLVVDCRRGVYASSQ
jgi:hypothetical protein